MAEFPTYEQMAKDVADKALDEYLINGKTLREWIKIIAEQEPCDDCISRQAVLEMMQMRISGKELYKAVYDLPPVTPQPKVGHWISNEEDDLKISEYTCSNCKGLSDYDTDFCSKCGAKMREVSE